MTDMNGKVALITGAASGLGKAIAELYAQHGASVAIADLNQQAADAVRAETTEDGGTGIATAVAGPGRRCWNRSPHSSTG